jgi:dienelactone hydrolase
LPQALIFSIDVVKPSDNPKRAIIDVYDVFGLAPQTIQGADRLSAACDAVVLVPDWFRGDYCDAAWFGPDAGAEQKAALMAFVKRQVDVERTVGKLVEVRREIADKWWPEVEGHVGVFGLCFGGKIAVVATGEGNEGKGRRFNVSGTAHPG